MEKVLIRLKIPSIEREFDVIVPTFLSTGDVLKLFIESVESITQNLYISSKQEILCRATPEMVLPKDATFLDCGIKNGETLYIL